MEYNKYNICNSKKYSLRKADNEDKNLIFKYKLETICSNNSIDDEELQRISNYLITNINKHIVDYKMIINNNKKIGVVGVYRIDDGYLLDEIYIESEYRNHGIGTCIIKNIQENIFDYNQKLYLWVYKNNIKAFNLYNGLGFVICDETDTRYYMVYKVPEIAQI